MKYQKPPITIDEQIATLKLRGLVIDDEIKAAHYLSHISYYRLRAYTYPFQDNDNNNHPFIKPVTFENIIQLYVFDRRLRILIFDAIEKIEVALRTQIIYNYALKAGSHWHLKPQLYNSAVYFAEHIASLQKEIDRSNETFIKHYKATYTDPKEPACWMSLEVSSMGLLSKIFSNLKRDNTKDVVTHHFGLKANEVLENWIFCLSIIRNICAHHGRIWNRRIPPITIPKKTIHLFIENKKLRSNKIYAAICNVQYLLNIISPQHHFKQDLLALMQHCPLAQEKEMGFTTNWKQEKFWQ